MEGTRRWKKASFSAILWAVAAIMLSAAPGWAEDITEPIDGPVSASGEVNVYADITYGIFAEPGSTVNIYAGAVGDGVYYGITVSTDSSLPKVTVYGTNFAVTTGIIEDGSWTPGSSGGILTGEYENGDPLNSDDDINLMFYSDIPVYLVDTSGGGPIEVQIDIKPGSDPNPINPGSNGLIPVAILTTDEFDAAVVDPDTVTLAGREVAVRGKAEKLMARLEDIDEDGDLDLMLQVDTQSDGDVWTSGSVTLTGKTYDGQDIEGTDDVIIVPPE